jgi:hypothetical protein
MSRKGLCRRKRVVGFGVHNCCLPSAHFTQRIRRKGRSSDSVHIGLCAVRAPCSPHVIIIMHCNAHIELVGTRFLLRVTSSLGPCGILGLSITPLIRRIVDSPFRPPPTTFLLLSTECRRAFRPRASQVTCIYDRVYECSPYEPRLHHSLRPG